MTSRVEHFTVGVGQTAAVRVAFPSRKVALRGTSPGHRDSENALN
jgi:hypothetical protein